MQILVPQRPQIYTGKSFLLELSPKYNQFQTYKAQIRRNIKIEEIRKRKAEKLAKKREELEKVKAENPGMMIDEELFLRKIILIIFY